MTFAEEIKRWRKNNNLSQKDMAFKYNIPKRTIENWEGEVNEPADWAKDLLIEKLMDDAEAYCEEKMRVYANECKSDENGKRPVVKWVVIDTDGCNEFMTECKDMRDALIEKDGGQVACILSNQGSLEWYMDRNGEIKSDYMTIE